MTGLAVRPTGGQDVQQYTAPTPDQVVELLQRAAAYDKRTFGHSEKAAWTSASQIGGWTFEEACRAIDHHKATRTEYLEPAHITRWINLERRKARCQGGYTEDGARIPTHTEALDLWIRTMRQTGANPTREQVDHVSEVLAQLLDGTTNALLIIQAILKAGEQLTSRVEWALEKLGRADEKWSTLLDGDMPEGIPLEFIPNRRLNVAFAIRQPDFPAEWRRYDPFGVEAERWAERAQFEGTKVMTNDPTPREIPEWVRVHREDKRPRQVGGRLASWQDVPGEGTPADRLAEAQKWAATEERCREWFEADSREWQTERLKVVRRWYEEHPDRRPSAYDSPVFAGGPRFEGYR